MEKRRIPNVRIDDARIMFRNFKGEEKVVNGRLVNSFGSRNFCVLLDSDLASAMINDGWNVKELKPREEGDLPQPYIQVGVRYDKYPPKIVLITSKKQTIMNEDMVGELDTANIKMVDLVFSPSFYNVNGKNGIKAYAKVMYITLEEDELEAKYARYDDEI